MFKKNTITSSTMHDLSDLLAKIHIEIQKEFIKQNQPQKENALYNRVQNFFVVTNYSSEERIRLLELCRDFLRNNKNLLPQDLELIFVKAPHDIKNIYHQIKNFTEQDKEYYKKIFNENGYITLDHKPKARKLV